MRALWFALCVALPGHLFKDFSLTDTLLAGNGPIRFVPTANSSIQSFCAWGSRPGPK